MADLASTAEFTLTVTSVPAIFANCISLNCMPDDFPRAEYRFATKLHSRRFVVSRDTVRLADICNLSPG
jgi:hypothetical protein